MKATVTRDELSKYLDEKGLNAILVKVVEAILLEQPDCPVEFIVNHLLNTYPDVKVPAIAPTPSTGSDGPEASSLPPQPPSPTSSPTPSPKPSPTPSATSSPLPSSLEPETIESKPMNIDPGTIGKKESGTQDVTPPRPNSNEASKDEGAMEDTANATAITGSYSLSESDNEMNITSDDDEEDQEDEKPPSGTKTQARRRRSICGENLNPSDTGGTTIGSKIPKTDEESERILQILKENVLFGHMADEELSTLRDAMFVVEKESGDVIIKQGDDGDNYYIIDSGGVDVYIKSGPEEQENKVTSYRDGDSFGELAILYNTRRAASCIASSACRLWALDRVSFKTIAVQTMESKRNEHTSFLQRVPVLQKLTQYEVLTVADALQELTFEDGHIVCEEGDAGDRFYVIKDGLAVCTKEGTEVARLTAGQYFGEIALLTDNPRQATVKAEGGPLTCLSLDRKTFSRVMGPLQEIMLRNLDQYNIHGVDANPVGNTEP